MKIRVSFVTDYRNNSYIVFDLDLMDERASVLDLFSQKWLVFPLVAICYLIFYIFIQSMTLTQLSDINSYLSETNIEFICIN